MTGYIEVVLEFAVELITTAMDDVLCVFREAEQAMNGSRHDEVIRVRQIKSDIDSFLHCDRGRDGDLSDGQRARINLARAINEIPIFICPSPP